MSLDKNKTIAEVGRRTCLRNHDVQKMLESLLEVWSEELAQEGRIEVENFLVLEVKCLDRGDKAGSLLVGGKLRRAPRVIKKLTVRPSKSLKGRLRTR
ncbi:MAG: HU family DNA-binding protein [Chloroflexota bacterium]